MSQATGPLTQHAECGLRNGESTHDAGRASSAVSWPCWVGDTFSIAPGTFRTGKSAAVAPHGFTLVEIMMVMLILGTIAGALFVSFLVGKNSFVTADAFVQVQQDARQALDVMARELRSVGNIPNPGNGAARATLEFQLPLGYGSTSVCGVADATCWGAVDASGTPRANWSLIYRLNGSQLVRQVVNALPNAGGAAQSTRVIANNLDAAQTSFTYDSNAKTVRLSLAVQINSAQIPGGRMNTGASPLTTTIKLRN